VTRDPGIGWDGPFPYEVLAPAGVTAHTSHADVQKVPFTLMSRRRLTPDAQQAWDGLRTVRRRMLVDLFTYDTGAGTDTDTGTGAGTDTESRTGARPGPGAGTGEEAGSSGTEGMGSAEGTAGPAEPAPPDGPDTFAVLGGLLVRFDR
jgi:hypothetical protein